MCGPCIARVTFIATTSSLKIRIQFILHARLGAPVPDPFMDEYAKFYYLALQSHYPHLCVCVPPPLSETESNRSSNMRNSTLYCILCTQVARNVKLLVWSFANIGTKSDVSYQVGFFIVSAICFPLITRFSNVMKLILLSLSYPSKIEGLACVPL